MRVKGSGFENTMPILESQLYFLKLGIILGKLLNLPVPKLPQL